MRTVLFPLALAVGLTAVMAMAGGGARAQSAACAPRAEVVKSLDGLFNEVPAVRAIVADGALMELFVSEEGTWTMLLTSPQQVSCLVGSGESWEDLPRSAPAGHSASLSLSPSTIDP